MIEKLIASLDRYYAVWEKVVDDWIIESGQPFVPDHNAVHPHWDRWVAFIEKRTELDGQYCQVVEIADELLIYPDGQHRADRAHFIGSTTNYEVFCAERDSFGWLRGGIRRKGYYRGNATAIYYG